MEYQHIRFEVRDGVGEVTLNRPDRLNAYTTLMGRELGDAFRICDERDDVRAVIVTGAGRGFCAGADLDGEGKMFAEDSGGGDSEAPAGVPPWRVRKPIIAAINGPAVGVGATLPLQWDIRIAAERARIGFVFVRRGLTPEAISTWTLPRLVGMSRAAELLYTGRILGAHEALAYGIVGRVVSDDDLLPAVRIPRARDRDRDGSRRGRAHQAPSLAHGGRGEPRPGPHPRRRGLSLGDAATRRPRRHPFLPGETAGAVDDAAEHRPPRSRELPVTRRE